MYVNGNLDIAGVVMDLKLERLATDPVAPSLSRVWFNSADKKIKYFDGTDIIALAAGGSLDNYLPLIGGTLTGALVLAADAVEAMEAVTKQQLDAGLGEKQATITGAASTVVASDLTADTVVVSDASGKIVASTVTTAELGLLSGITGNVQEQIDSKEDALGYVPVNKAGDSVNGNLTFGGTAQVKNLAAPVDAGDAVRLADLEAAMLGLDIQADVLGTEADFVDQAGRYIFVDGSVFTGAVEVSAEAGDIVVVDAAGAITSVAYDVSAAGPGALAWNRDSATWNQFVGGSSWTEFGGLSGVTPGVGLAKDGNTISVRLGAGIADLPNGEVGVEVKANGGLALVDPTTGEASVATDAVLGVVAGSALEVGASGVGVAAAGITAAHLNADIAGNGIAGGNGVALNIEAGTGIVVSEDGVAFDETYGDARYLTLTGGTLTGELILSGDATNVLSPVTKQQLDAVAQSAGGDVTALVSRLESGVFVYEEVTTAAVSHTVTHNLGNKYGTVVVTDENDEMVIPQSVTYNTANSLTVTFASASLCRVIVSGVKAAA